MILEATVEATQYLGYGNTVEQGYTVSFGILFRSCVLALYPLQHIVTMFGLSDGGIIDKESTLGS